MQPIHANFMSLVLKLYIYIYIYMYVCVHTLFLHAVVHVDESSSVFSISSPGDFISFPHLFDHFVKRIWSVLISLSQKKCFPPISSFCCLVHQLSQVFPIYFSSWSLQFVFSSPKFSQPIGACYHWVSSVFPTYFLSSSWCFMSFGCLFLHCIIRFHQSSSPKSSLYHSFSSVFSHLLVIFITSH